MLESGTCIHLNTMLTSKFDPRLKELSNLINKQRKTPTTTPRPVFI